MKRFTIWLLSAVFVTLIACSIQSISADHLEPGPGIFLDENDVELVSYWTTESSTIQGSSYQVYLQTVLRNGDGELINVTEVTRTGAFVRHEITDHVFDTLMGKKEIITIDGIKYEKIQHVFTSTLQPTYRTGPFFSDANIELTFNLAEDPEMDKKIRDYSIWKIQYCADFSAVGHDWECIPVFQVLVPTTALEPDDIITQQWTILRELN